MVICYDKDIIAAINLSDFHSFISFFFVFQSAKAKLADLLFGTRELKRNFHSTPDLAQDVAIYSSQTLPSKFHRSQEDLSVLLSNRNLPPPSYPPPPIPPQVQVVKVDVSRNKASEYNTLSKEISEEGNDFEIRFFVLKPITNSLIHKIYWFAKLTLFMSTATVLK